MHKGTKNYLPTVSVHGLTMVIEIISLQVFRRSYPDFPVQFLSFRALCLEWREIIIYNTIMKNPFFFFFLKWPHQCKKCLFKIESFTF